MEEREAEGTPACRVNLEATCPAPASRRGRRQPARKSSPEGSVAVSQGMGQEASGIEEADLGELHGLVLGIQDLRHLELHDDSQRRTQPVPLDGLEDLGCRQRINLDTALKRCCSSPPCCNLTFSNLSISYFSIFPIK